VDLLTEGKYAEMMVKRPKTGGDLVTWVWAMYFTAGLIGSSIAGPMSDNCMIREMFWIAVPFAAQVAIPALCKFFPERQLAAADRGVQWATLKKNRPYFIVAAAMACGSVGLALVSLYATSWKTKLAYALTCSVVLCIIAHMMLPKMLSRANLYMFLAAALYLQLPGPLDFFYTAPPACLADGPHFDLTYYITYSSIVSSVVGVIGVMLFQTLMRDWHFRPVFWVTTVLRGCGAIVDIIIINRWNTEIGISDKVMYMLGNNILFTVVSMLDWMPGIVLTSKLCPRGMESTVYALLAGFQNFGQAIAISLGQALSNMLEVRLASAWGRQQYPRMHAKLGWLSCSPLPHATCRSTHRLTDARARTRRIAPTPAARSVTPMTPSAIYMATALLRSELETASASSTTCPFLWSFRTSCFRCC